jgi:hypothetical protein
VHGSWYLPVVIAVPLGLFVVSICFFACYARARERRLQESMKGVFLVAPVQVEAATLSSPDAYASEAPMSRLELLLRQTPAPKGWVPPGQSASPEYSDYPASPEYARPNAYASP